MKHIGNLTYTEGSKTSKKRIGRGPGSGHGGTATRGHKGQQSRSGATVARGTEGGQMPIHRRLPKFGFTNIFRVEYQTVNLGLLQEFIDKKKIDASNINLETLLNCGLIKKSRLPFKILGNGEINQAITLTADSVSDIAKEKIEKLGGIVTING